MFRTDSNHGSIVEALRKAGAVVYPIEGMGGVRGVPDLLVAARNQTFLLECKRPLGPKGGAKDRELTKEQEAFAKAWVLQGGPCAVVRSPEEALFVVFGK